MIIKTSKKRKRLEQNSSSHNNSTADNSLRITEPFFLSYCKTVEIKKKHCEIVYYVQ